MSEGRHGTLEERVLILAPTARDAATSREILAAAGIPCHQCGTLKEVCLEAVRGASAAILTAEAVVADHEGCLATFLHSQPSWSDFPIIVLTAPGADSPKLLHALAAVGHTTLMKRPVQVSTLLSSVQTALRDRQRQYAARAHMKGQQQAANILESINEGFVILDAEWRFTYVNAAFETLAGVGRKDLLGKNHWEMYPATVGTRLETEYRRALAEQTTIEFENYYEPWDRWFRVKVYPAAENGICVQTRDVTERRLSEIALREKEERLQLLIGHAIDYALIMMDAQGHVLEWSGGAEQITGWSEADLYGKPADVLFTAEERSAGIPENEMQQAVQNGRAEDKRWHLRKDGTFFYADGIMVALRGPDGNLRGFGKVFQDMTERKWAEEALARDALVLANVHDAVIMTDADGVVTYWNEGATRLFGWEADEMIGRPYVDRFPESVKPWISRELASRLAGTAWHGEFEDYRKDGSRIWIDARVTRILDDGGRVIGILGVSHEITERKKAEEALRETDRRKDDFIALLAHELRNPLAPIRNGLQVMRLAGDNVQAIGQARAMMDRQLSHMVRLIDDLLDVSRISRNKMELRRSRVLLEDVIGSAIETARPAIDAEAHELSVRLPAEPVFLDADLTRLAQVFSNLLTNSAKYTRRGGHIWVEAEIQGCEVVVAVRDDGIGIPADAISNIFDMFSQVDRSIERSTGGLGIGLALVKGLVEMHGGTVSAMSERSSSGSTFTVRLPRLETQSSLPAKELNAEKTAANLSQRRILTVDDNRDSATSLAMMLRLMGNEVTTAHDGLEALELAERFRPDIIFMDVGMPRLNGLEATRRIRTQPWGQAMTIIALTGWGQDYDKEQSRVAGCNGHLVKPVNLPDLQKLLHDLAGRSLTAGEAR